MIKPQINKYNNYTEEEIFRVVIVYSRIHHINIEYMLACFEFIYPFFSCKADAEEAFEVALDQYTLEKNNVPLSQIISIIITDLANFKKHRAMK